MANGVSCAFFAAKNIVNGTKEKNIFKEGIGIAQTIRTADAAFMAATNTANAANKAVAEAAISSVEGAAAVAKVSPIANLLSKGAAIAKKLLYPLICLSAAYNTFKSKDKVKTGVSQSSAIGTMYMFEKLTEKNIIKNIEQKYAPTFKNNKKAAVLWYIARGLIFATTSMTGYTLGSKAGEISVDAIRTIFGIKKGDSFNSSTKSDESNVFDEIELQ